MLVNAVPGPAKFLIVVPSCEGSATKVLGMKG